MEFIERYIDLNNWITLLLLSCFILFGITKYLYSKRFEEFVLLPITDKYFLISGKSNSIQHPFNLLLFVTHVLLAGLFIFTLFGVFNPELVKANPYLFLQIVTAYTVFTSVKFCVEKIIGAIFSIDAFVDQYLYQKLTYKNLITLLIFSICVLLIYAIPPSIILIYIFSSLIVLGNCISLIYSLKKGKKLILNNFFYFILYLCALEISPYIILYKVLV